MKVVSSFCEKCRRCVLPAQSCQMPEWHFPGRCVFLLPLRLHCSDTSAVQQACGHLHKPVCGDAPAGLKPISLGSGLWLRVWAGVLAPHLGLCGLGQAPCTFSFLIYVRCCGCDWKCTREENTHPASLFSPLYPHLHEPLSS